MRSPASVAVFAVLFASIAISAEPTGGKSEIFPELRSYLDARAAEFD